MATGADYSLAGIADATVRDSSGNEVECTANGTDEIVFATRAGETYVIAWEPSVSVHVTSRALAG